MNIQITLVDPSGRYKPLSTLIEVDSVKDFNTNQKEYIKKAKIRLMARHYWDSSDLKRYGYTEIKARVYDKEKIEKENQERYEKIKEEKYATGEWKKPIGR